MMFSLPEEKKNLTYPNEKKNKQYAKLKKVLEVMSRHSKNVCASAVFRSSERERLPYGTQKAILSKDSLSDYDACCLCLNKAKDPLMCPDGHLFCRVCIYENILHQKKEIQEKMDAWTAQEAQRKHDEIEQERAKEEDSKAVFERSETGIEKVVTSKSEERLCFWAPSASPSAPKDLLTRPSKRLICPGGGHEIKFSKLRPVVFHTSNELKEGENGNITHECPVCKMTFLNSTRVLVPPCGHAVCGHCFDKMKEEAGKNKVVCGVCSAQAKTKQWYTLQQGGTGFSGHDGNKMTVEKFTPVARV